MAAQAQITVQTVTLPTNIGRGQVVDVDITWLRNAVGAGNDAISTQLAPQVQVQPPALPAGCSLSGSNVICAIGGGGVIGDHGHIIFQVQGALIGGFNLTATASNLAGAPLGGSSATGSGNVTSAGDLTVGKTKSSPAGNPIAGQTTVFVVTPQLSGGADDVPASGQIVVTDNLPGTSTDYALTNVSTSGLSPACTATGTANTTRTLTCTYSGPFTAAQLNASSITLTGTPGTNGSFTNVASIASGNPNYYDSNPLNNITNLNYTVDVGSDLQAQGSFPAGAVMVSSAQSLTI